MSEPVALYHLGKRTDAGEAIAGDADAALSRILEPLLDAGFDPYHVEHILVREVAWVITLWKLSQPAAGASDT